MRGISWTAFALIGLNAFVAGAQSQAGIESFHHGQYQRAAEQLKDAEDDAGKAFYGLALAGANRCDAALPHLLIPSKDDATARLQSLAAVKCYLAENRFSAASSLLDTLEKSAPNDSDVLYLRAKLHMKAFNEATLAMFQRAPASFRVHQLSAEVLETQSRFSEAAAEYRKAIELNPQAVDLHFRLGRAILFQSHDEKALQDASAAFEEELKLTPEDAACAFQLGQIAQVRGDSLRAKQRFEQALQWSPNFVNAMVSLAKIASREKRTQDAIKLLTRAVELQPGN